MLLTATAADLSRTRLLQLGAAVIACLVVLFSTLVHGQEAMPADPDTASMNAGKSESAKPDMMVESRIDKTLPAEQKVGLSVDGINHRAYYLKETSGKAHGGVIIVPEINQHPVSSGEINALRHVLANQHWHTLALNMESDNLATVNGIIAAAVQYLNQQGIYNIALLGQGGGAPLAINYVATLPAPPPGEFQQLRALILLNAKNQHPSTSKPLDSLAQLSAITLPVLDAYINGDFQQQQYAKMRKAISRQRGKLYRQARLPLSDYSDITKDNSVTKRIRGWLDNNIAGFMVDKG